MRHKPQLRDDAAAIADEVQTERTGAGRRVGSPVACPLESGPKPRPSPRELAVAPPPEKWDDRVELALSDIGGCIRKATADAHGETIQHEMLDLMERDEQRLAAYREASTAWAGHWPKFERELERLPLLAAHAQIVARAERLLPREVRP